MRDPKRIDKILNKIKHLWKKYPDLRLFQLLINASGQHGDPGLYYLEDDILLQALNLYDKTEELP